MLCRNVRRSRSWFVPDLIVPLSSLQSFKVLVSLSSSSRATGRSRHSQVLSSTHSSPRSGWPSVLVPASRPYVYMLRSRDKYLNTCLGQSMTSANASIAAGVLDSISAGILIYTYVVRNLRVAHPADRDTVPRSSLLCVSPVV